MNTLISCSLGIFMIVTGAMAQTGTVRGWVTTSDGAPATGTNVVILGTSPLRGAVVKQDGSYCVQGVRPGRYDVKLGAIGFRGERIHFIEVLPDKEVRLDAVIFAPRPHQCNADIYSDTPGCGNPLYHADTLIVLPTAGDSVQKAIPLLNDNFGMNKSNEYPITISDEVIGNYREFIFGGYSFS